MTNEMDTGQRMRHHDSIFMVFGKLGETKDMLEDLIVEIETAENKLARGGDAKKPSPPSMSLGDFLRTSADFLNEYNEDLKTKISRLRSLLF